MGILDFLNSVLNSISSFKHLSLHQFLAHYPQNPFHFKKVNLVDSGIGVGVGRVKLSGWQLCAGLSFYKC